MPKPEPTKTPPAVPAAGAPKDNAAKPVEQKPEDMVRVYNRTRKQFSHEVYKDDADGRAAAKYLSAPASFVTIPRWLAEKWLGMFPEELLAGDDALKAIDPNQSELIALKEKGAQLESDKAQLDAEVAELKKQLAEARGDK